MKGDIISCCYTKLIYICFQIQQTGYDGGKKINDLENTSTETSQTESKIAKKQTNTFTKVYQMPTAENQR